MVWLAIDWFWCDPTAACVLAAVFIIVILGSHKTYLNADKKPAHHFVPWLFAMSKVLQVAFICLSHLLVCLLQGSKRVPMGVAGCQLSINHSSTRRP